MRIAKFFSFLCILLAGTSLPAYAQDKSAIQQKLTSQFALTKTTADKSDIVTAGAILVLKKDGLLMVDVTSSNLYQNTYKDGKITQNAFGKLSHFHLPGMPSAPSSGASQRIFVAGEKMWVTDLEVKDTGVSMELYSDPIGDNSIRYRAVLSFPFKGSAPIDQQAEKMVAEVFDVQPSDNSAGNAQQQPASGQQQAVAGGQSQAADTAPAPIPPPPPPADAPPPAPKTVSLGQTKDMVVAIMGQPQMIAKLGAKEIYTYPGLKVTFVNGKVTDAQ